MDPKRHFLIGAGLGIGLLLFYGPGFLRLMELKSERAHLESQIAALQKENQRLAEEIRRLREDPAYAEAVARRELGFVRPGETVIQFEKSRSEGKTNPKQVRR